MGFRSGDESVEIECKVIKTTAKAYLVEDTTTNTEIWLPKSQVYSMSGPDIDGNVAVQISEWIAKQKGLI